MAKVRVYELAKEFDVESKIVMTKLNEMGEFVRSASSTLEAPVVRRLRKALASIPPEQDAGSVPPQQAESQQRPQRSKRRRSNAIPRNSAGRDNAGDQVRENNKLEILQLKEDILEAWTRIVAHIPEEQQKRPNAWIINATGEEPYRIKFAGSVRNWIAHPKGDHKLGIGTLRDALRVMQELERRLSNRHRRGSHP
jgi:hypothetical protein